MSYQQQCQTILADPGTSFWLKGAINALNGRDPCDAINDVEALLEVARARMSDTPQDKKAPDDTNKIVERDMKPSQCTRQCNGVPPGENWVAGGGRLYCMFCGGDA